MITTLTPFRIFRREQACYGVRNVKLVESRQRGANDRLPTVRITDSVTDRVKCLVHVRIVNNVGIGAPILHQLSVAIGTRYVYGLMLVFRLTQIGISVARLRTVTRQGTPKRFVSRVTVQVRLAHVFLNAARSTSFRFALLIPFLSQESLFRFQVIQYVKIYQEIIKVIIVVFLTRRFTRHVVVGNVERAHANLTRATWSFANLPAQGVRPTGNLHHFVMTVNVNVRHAIRIRYVTLQGLRARTCARIAPLRQVNHRVVARPRQRLVSRASLALAYQVTVQLSLRFRVIVWLGARTPQLPIENHPGRATFGQQVESLLHLSVLVFVRGVFPRAVFKDSGVEHVARHCQEFRAVAGRLSLIARGQRQFVRAV